MSRRDWGRPGVPWYAKGEARRGGLSTYPLARLKMKAYFERTGTLYGASGRPSDEADRPDPGADLTNMNEQPATDEGSYFTLEEVGMALGVSKERVRCIEAKALRKLRHPSRSKHLQEFL